MAVAQCMTTNYSVQGVRQTCVFAGARDGFLGLLSCGRFRRARVRRTLVHVRQHLVHHIAHLFLSLHPGVFDHGFAAVSRLLRFAPHRRIFDLLLYIYRFSVAWLYQLASQVQATVVKFNRGTHPHQVGALRRLSKQRNDFALQLAYLDFQRQLGMAVGRHRKYGSPWPVGSPEGVYPLLCIGYAERSTGGPLVRLDFSAFVRCFTCTTN